MMNSTALQLSLVANGVPEAIVQTVTVLHGFKPVLEVALELIVDPEQRTHEFAQALAEMRAGRVPTIVLNLLGGE
jgi:hypothetical protein